MKITLTIDAKWYFFSQNNSGGFFVCDDNVSEYVLIQAANAKDAIRKAEEFCDNSDSCPCCGDRWSFWLDDDDGHEEPEIYGEKLWNVSATYYRSEAKLHMLDGQIITYKLGDPIPDQMRHLV